MINIISIKDHVSAEDAFMNGRLQTLNELIELFSNRDKRKGALQEIKVIARKELMRKGK